MVCANYHDVTFIDENGKEIKKVLLGNEIFKLLDTGKYPHLEKEKAHFEDYKDFDQKNSDEE